MFSVLIGYQGRLHSSHFDVGISSEVFKNYSQKHLELIRIRPEDILQIFDPFKLKGISSQFSSLNKIPWALISPKFYLLMIHRAFLYLSSLDLLN